MYGRRQEAPCTQVTAGLCAANLSASADHPSAPDLNSPDARALGLRRRGPCPRRRGTPEMLAGAAPAAVGGATRPPRLLAAPRVNGETRKEKVPHISCRLGRGLNHHHGHHDLA